MSPWLPINKRVDILCSPTLVGSFFVRRHLGYKRVGVELLSFLLAIPRGWPSFSHTFTTESKNWCVCVCVYICFQILSCFSKPSLKFLMLMKQPASD